MQPEGREPLIDELRDFRRATTAGFNALRADMVDGFAEMRAKFDLAAAGQRHIAEMLQHLIDGRGADPA